MSMLTTIGWQDKHKPRSGYLQRTHLGTVVHWLERANDDGVVGSSNPTETDWKLWEFPLLIVASVFRKMH